MRVRRSHPRKYEGEEGGEEEGEAEGWRVWVMRQAGRGAAAEEGGGVGYEGKRKGWIERRGGMACGDE